ncbi:MAG: MlaE family ABC transporter permease [Bacillota bacterium]
MAELNSLAIRFLNRIGRNIIRFFQRTCEMLYILYLAWQSVIYKRYHKANTMEQYAVIGASSLPIALTIALSTGMVLSLQVSREFARFGAMSLIGQVLGWAFARELGPVLCAVVIAGRVGSSITAEIGSMKVTEQLDAMKTLSTDPIDYLIAPRLIAGVLMLPLLAFLSDLVGILGGFWVAVIYAGLRPSVFFDSLIGKMAPYDFLSGMFKAAVFGLLIVMISCYYGLRAEKGAVGVGRVTTRSVVVSTIVIFVTDFFMSMLLYPHY